MVVVSAAPATVASTTNRRYVVAGEHTALLVVGVSVSGAEKASHLVFQFKTKKHRFIFAITRQCLR